MSSIPNSFSFPLMPVRDVVVFPQMIVPLIVGREKSVLAVEEAFSKNRFLFLATQKEVSEEIPHRDGLHSLGVVVMIMRLRRLPDGRLKILVQGINKGKISKFLREEPFHEVEVEKVADEQLEESKIKDATDLMRKCRLLLEQFQEGDRDFPPDIFLMLEDIEDPGRLSDMIAAHLSFSLELSQKLLEELRPLERLKLVIQILEKEREKRGDLSDRPAHHMHRNQPSEAQRGQREHFLREQMKAIKSELGESDVKSEEIEEYKNKIEQAKMPKQAEAEALKQLNRLERMHPDSSEAAMIRNFLDWMVDLPWSKASEDEIELDAAQTILDEDHYELKKVKNRILEFLAVKKLKGVIKGPILCFVGPPGVGKTSLGRSIARSMKREYVRIALGGLKDESEIRGHRRTYVGAMPGKFIQAMKQAKTKNPVILLDEIDKLGSDFRGDPSAALLEVLDPEQNSTFRDHYLNVDFDLSQVMFIATANVADSIPAPLRDRMEMIHIPGYTQKEKLEIAKKHLIRKQIDQNGLHPENIKISDAVIESLIRSYTREAGLRNLEREIGSICRKVALKVVKDPSTKSDIQVDELSQWIGPPKFQAEDSPKEPRLGVVTGLAWTGAGGEILSIEAVKFKGKGGVQLTGQLGDVMKESAQASLSYAKANAEVYKISPKVFEEFDIHIHIPQGAIPKDGPSAGVTLSTAIISLLSGIPVSHEYAMTGEITLQGKVLPVGGIREKSLAALMNGIKKIILPKKNEKDVQEIPEDFRGLLEFYFVENLDEVLALVLDKKALKVDGPKESGKKDGVGSPKRSKSGDTSPTAA